LTSVALLLPTAAFAAEDGTRMPGSACKLGLPQAGDTTLYAVDEIYNSSDKAVAVTCPIARNVIDSSSLEYASVLAEKGVTCTLLLMTEVADFFGNPANTATEQAGSFQRLVWGRGDEDVFTPPGGTYTFLCTLPPQTGIYNYYIVENDGED
jgi:hypothetical protein